MSTADKILVDSKLLLQIEKWKEGGETIVFTNGCFDLLHLGHVDYLEKAAEKGTKLIVAINTDSSVKKLKGPNIVRRDFQNYFQMIHSLPISTLLYIDLRQNSSVIKDSPS